MGRVNFVNENNVEIVLPVHPFSNILSSRVNSEKKFREINTFLLNNQIIDKTKNIIDLGSWIGDNSIPWSLNITGVIYAIDPSKENGDFIEEVKKSNNIKNIIFINEVIGAKVSTVSTNDDINHKMFLENENGKYSFKTTTLDILYNEKIIINIDFIHLDAEGMELSIIEGSKNLINKERPVISFEQHLNTDKYDEIISILKDENYETFLIDEVFEGCRIDCRNFISFPVERNIEDLLKIYHNILKKF